MVQDVDKEDHVMESLALAALDPLGTLAEAQIDALMEELAADRDADDMSTASEREDTSEADA